ncbi:MAG: RusA family crossover junction endodeoxyribonuclease [Nitrosopumilus sp.]|nr:RusA family crossover junction endodeoxyribonuclease [Nitrosopumilus sp.]MDH3487880.1 RusA family crossover junction endodeoxyribonuclease [Nitrosopumilus sp.]
MKWDVVLPKIEIRNYPPVIASSKKVERKQELFKKLKKEIGKDLPKIKKLSVDKPLTIDVCYYILASDESGKSKKDLDNLLKILFDVLSVNMRNGHEPLKGLGLMRDDTYVYKIKCEKKENSKNREGFDLKILRRI